ncbi:MAG: GNAT family N-acetyltransferase [Halofilum sp. (in: g-proteobacteria)]|nr:GNAT family N-acetyltransferase [Halofilum sp. (in: g-proteobacteria)]
MRRLDARPTGLGEIESTLGHVRHFATHPDWTGRGIGRAIHERSRDQALAAGILRFACYASLNAVPFYAALGFRPVRRVEVPIAHNIAFPAMLMTLDLNDS